MGVAITSFFPCLIFAAAASAQGLLPEWESRKLAQSVVESTARLTPVLDQILPNDWAKNGGPEGYVRQLQSIKNGIYYISVSAKQFSADPQKLSAALDTYMRMQWVEGQVGSLEQGVRKYQNPAIADKLVAAITENSVARTQLQKYVIDLASYRETELSVMAREAQQCRSAVTRPQQTLAPGRAK